MTIIWAAARWALWKIGALWMAGWIGGSSVIGTSSNSYSMGITGVWYVGEIAIGCVLFALVMAKPIKRVSDELRNVTFPELIHARYDQKTAPWPASRPSLR